MLQDFQYGTLFPKDVTFTIGKSNYAKDWFFQHVPHNENPEAKSKPFIGAYTQGRATPYTIVFSMERAVHGKVVLRCAICGTGTKELEIEVNGAKVGKIKDLSPDGVITRHGTQGIWYERNLCFDASLLRKGENKLIITVPAGSVNKGIMYDYIRLELVEN